MMPAATAATQAIATLPSVLAIAGHIRAVSRSPPRSHTISLGGMRAKRSIAPKRHSASQTSSSASAMRSRAWPGVMRWLLSFLFEVVGQKTLVDDLRPVRIVLQRADDLLRAHHLVH